MKRTLADVIFHPEAVKRMIIYGIFVLALGCAQCSFFPLISICPATPDLMLGMLLAIILLDGEKSAAIVAIAGGFFIDSIGSSGLFLSPLIYFLFVLIMSVPVKKVLAGFPAYLLLLVPTLAYRALSTFICLALWHREMPSPALLWDTLVPEAVCTALLCIPVYFLIKLASSTFENRGKFSF